MRNVTVAAGLAIALTAPKNVLASEPLAVEPVTEERARRIDEALTTILADHQIVTAGAALIRDGEAVWTGYYGEQAPGIPASRDTLFNAASITKTVAAETVLRLVDAGLVSLDEPMARHWTDPDIAGDSRAWLLTPRRALTHMTGFPNWRFLAPGGRLSFVRDPGETFGYSGEGFEYLARFVEAKLDRDFKELVEEQVFDPIGMDASAFGQHAANYSRMARPIDEEGAFHGYFCRPRTDWCRAEGGSSAADDMTATVEDYAAFLIAVMNHRGYGESLAAARDTVWAPETERPPIDCAAVPADRCPLRMGYGLGWRVLDYGSRHVVQHGGSDWSELALGYFIHEERDGVIVFLNAPNARGTAAMPEILELLDPDSPMIAHYRERAMR